ncbi:MAG: glycosyltransferase [Candidatus Altiarchaeota archaeon]|nr:glycosyltransferase [Candidatus Altiarchaeota archaeon]
MKIGFFTDSYFPQVNGVTFTLEAWKKKLEEIGHEVYIYYPSGDYTPKSNEFAFPSFEFRFYQGYRLAIPWGIVKKSKNLDIVHQHGLYTMAVGGLLSSRENKTPRLLTFHTPGDEYINYLPLAKYLKKTYTKSYLLWERWLLKKYGKITTASPVIMERLKENKITDIEILSNGVDLEMFHEAYSADFRKQHKIKSEKVIGFCGRLGFEKHVEDLINAADEFDGHILIAGDGPARKHYEKLAHGKKNVKILGFVKRDELKKFYSAIDVFVFPSFCETQGLVALEAMACGTPVVAVPVAALKTTVDDGVTGYHYQPADTKDLLSKVNLCYTNMKRLKRGCLKEAGKNSVDNSVKRLVEIYSELD